MTTGVFLCIVVLVFSVIGYFEFPADWYYGDSTTDYEGNICSSMMNCFLSSLYFVNNRFNFFYYLKGIR